MGRIEAEGKLRHYADSYGDWIYGLTVTAARCISEARGQAAKLHDGKPEGLNACVERVQFDTIAQCIEIINA